MSNQAMDEREAHEAVVAALAWFDRAPLEGDWVNMTWIAKAGDAELRLVDVVQANARHRVLLRYLPSDDPVEEWRDLEYDEVQAIVERIKQTSWANRWPLFDFAGPIDEPPAWFAEGTLS